MFIDPEDDDSWIEGQTARREHILSLQPPDGLTLDDMYSVFWPCLTCRSQNRRLAPPGMDQKLCEENNDFPTVAIPTHCGNLRHFLTSPAGLLSPVVCLNCWNVGFLED